MSLLKEIKQAMGQKKPLRWDDKPAQRTDPKTMTLGTRIKAAMPGMKPGNVEDRRGEPAPEVVMTQRGPMVRQPGSYRSQPGYPGQIDFPGRGKPYENQPDGQDGLILGGINRPRRK